MKILVANRGEIALRVMRSIQEMGHSCIGVYSEADKDSPHVEAAAESWCLGPAPAAQSYLDINKVITAAKLSGAAVVHPGYGFLSENPDFASACEQAGLVFIGPRGAVMRALADKAATKERVAKAGVPVIPGSQGPVSDLERAKACARDIGYPVLVKASFGGGGRGIYPAASETDLARAWEMARSEAKAAVGKTELYLERFLDDSRHIEVQVAIDKKGVCRAFVERDCTIQRRNQKLLEESPSPFVTAPVRAKMLAAAVKAATACELTALATVEFLLVAQKDEFYFMEINKRIQVEHPVTEELLGLDLVRLQVALALGEPMPAFSHIEDPGSAHAIEARINAEDPAQGFLPQEGWVDSLILPGGPGVRVDTFLKDHLYVGSDYDSLLAKVIASSKQGRSQALSKLRRCLSELKIEGLMTTARMHRRLVDDPIFTQSERWYSTGFMAQWLQTQKWN
ncbi:MAG: biotin carboxylase N-terminal domain-containing protein [Elusimicrobiota bacterium]